MKRLKRWHKVVIVLVVVLVVLPVAAWIVADELGRAAVRRELAKIKAAGEALSWDELAPKPVPDEENAALMYQRAFALLKESKDDTEECLVQALDFDVAWEDETALVAAAERRGIPLRPPALNEAAAWETAGARLERNREALGLVRQAAAMDRCWFDLDYSAGLDLPLPHLGPLANAARLLSLSTRVKRHDGDLAGAFDDTIAGLRLERATQQPILVSYLLGNLVIRLAVTQIRSLALETRGDHPTGWKRLLGELGKIHRAPEFRKTTEGERLFGRWAFNVYPRHPSGLGINAPRVRANPLAAFLRAPVLKREEVCYLRVMGETVRLSKKPPWETLDQTQALKKSFSEVPVSATLTRTLVPAVTEAFPVNARAEADLALARVALALKLYKHEHGAYPDKLDALAPGILKAVPPDPCSGKPLVYRREGDGFILYSVGIDQTDNGGNEKPPDKSDRDQGVDIVWRADR